jgi:excisionase family DNA binding protein
MSDSLPTVITVDEAAELLRVDRKTVYTAVQRGKLPGVRKVGRAIRIHRPTLVAWLGADGPRPAGE